MNKGATDFTAVVIGYVMGYVGYVMGYITINTNNLEESTQHSHYIIYIYVLYIYTYHYVCVYIYVCVTLINICEQF